jgi:hypothetical protein
VPNGLAPGNSGYGPALWNACEKFGLYIAVGADPAVLEMPMPFMAVAPKAAAFDTLKNLDYRSSISRANATLPHRRRLQVGGEGQPLRDRIRGGRGGRRRGESRRDRVDFDLDGGVVGEVYAAVDGGRGVGRLKKSVRNHRTPRTNRLTCAPGRIGIGWLTGSRPNRILFAL